MVFENVVSQLDPVPQGLQVTDTFLDAIRRLRWAGGCDETDDIAATETGWADGVHGERVF